MSTPELDDEHCYRALTARDSRFDGVFFVAVKSTRIYCRPVCTVKTPQRRSCNFFSTAAAAEAAGFRPCLRCRPELAPYDLQQNLAFAVWKKIVAGELNEHSIEQLAEKVGLSSRQLRRVLVQHFGVSPVELAQTQRLLFAKKLLQETELSMTELAYAAGFGSVRRFNALFSERYQMAPTAVRRQRAGKQEGLLLRMAYRPPYAWQALLSYLKGRAMPGLEAVTEDGSYVRSVRMAGLSGWLRVQHLPDSKQLLVQVAPELAPQLMPLLARVRNQFDLDANPSIIRQHLQTHPLFAQQLALHPGLRVPGAFDSFELAIRAILGQQVSVAGATTIAGRLVHKFGLAVTTPFAAITHHFPTPAALAEADVGAIAQLGMPQTRAATVQNIARFTLAGGLDFAPGLSLEEVVRSLRTVGGIGEWTAQYIAMRALRFPDAFPAGDLGLQKAAAADGQRLTEKQLLQEAAQWSPWRAYAALLLWQSLATT